MGMNPIQQYLNDIGTARATQAGTAETSYYPALVTLLNEIGKTLNPKVRCVIQLQNRGAGIPDGGMFTADQFKRKAGVTMPGRGKTVANGDALDIYLNGQTCWRNVPVPVWEYTIGGYQVIKKWLSYREKPLLGRGLTVDEVRYVTETARRLAALVSLQPALDANYKAVAEATFDLCSIK